MSLAGSGTEGTLRQAGDTLGTSGAPGRMEWCPAGRTQGELSPGGAGGAAGLGQSPCSSESPCWGWSCALQDLWQVLTAAGRAQPHPGQPHCQCGDTEFSEAALTPESAQGEELGVFPTISPLFTPTCHFKQWRRKVTL